MAKSYSESLYYYLGQANSEGLGYPFYKTASVIPAAIGHFFDTILGIDGIFPAKDSHFVGPLGILLGIIPLLLGYIVGNILEIIFKAFCYIGYYVFDVPITFVWDSVLKDHFNFWRLPRLQLDKFMIDGEYSTIVGILFDRVTEKKPKQMNGFFGFILGAIPHVVRHIFNLVTAHINSFIDFTVNNTCEGIAYLYSLDYDPVPPVTEQLQDHNQKASQSHESAGSHSVEQSEPQPKRSRIRRPKARVEEEQKNEEINPDLTKAIGERLNLFAELGISFEDYQENSDCVRNAYKRLTRVWHVDKFQAKGEIAIATAAEKFERIRLANEILKDRNSDVAGKYLAFYEQNKDELSAALPLNPPQESPSVADNAATVGSPSPVTRPGSPAPPVLAPLSRQAQPTVDWRQPPAEEVSAGGSRHTFHANIPGQPASGSRPTGKGRYIVRQRQPDPQPSPSYTAAHP